MKATNVSTRSDAPTRDILLALIEQHYRTFWHGDLADLDRELAADFVDEDTPDAPPGPAAVKQHAARMRSAFPDMTVTIDNAIIEGRSAAVRATWRGTHLGPSLGIAPTGRPVSFQALVLWRIDEHNRIVRRMGHIDQTQLLSQLT